jgi:Ca-activated chloride channel homolog
MKKRLFLLLFLLLSSVGIAQAQDIIDPPCCGVFTDPSWLKIDYQRVTVDIENQIATTNVDMQFTNEGDGLAEGTFIFPLPQEAAIDQLTMFIDGQPIEAKILPAGEAREIYDAIVRQYRDPALLEYIGNSAIQANVFPIPPGESRRIEFSYSQILEVENGLIQYTFPMNSDTLSSRSIGLMSISVTVDGNDPISNVYSPTHNIGTIIDDGPRPTGFRTSWEASNYNEGEDFNLFYGLAQDTINVNLLTYRESALEDGFFMLLVQPPFTVPDDEVIAKDVIIVLDQSGSMSGEKWDQATEATGYVLENLNAQDRFNVVMFSTGARIYSRELEPASNADEAIDWVDNNFPEGGTNINEALLTAIDQADPDRETTILFLTDGLATEGVIYTDEILANLQAAEADKVRIFTFGVGDDVDTFLLDQIVQDYRGTSSYVRPFERIEEEVASLYNKISAPVLTSIDLDFGAAFVELLYPQTVTDLFAGEQLTIVGRYRDGIEDFTLTLSGEVNGETQRFLYDGLELRERAGGEAFVARLWATRRIGDLLTSIRLNGESDELVDSIVDLSVRYGIITPYTSFLIEEDDILTQTGRDRAEEGFAQEAEELAGVASGQGAVDAADDIGGLRDANAPAAMPTAPNIQQAAPADMEMEGEAFDEALSSGEQRRQDNALTTVEDKTFIQVNGVWTDTTFEPDTMTTEQIVFLSDAYFDLLTEIPELGDYLALGERVIVVYDGTAYEIVADES